MSERLAEIRARADKATPGPWRWNNTQDPYLFGARHLVVMAFARMGMQGAQPQFRDEHNLLMDAGRLNLRDFPDAVFIENARTDVGHLLDLINRVRAAIGEHRTSQGPAATVPVWALERAIDGGEG